MLAHDDPLPILPADLPEVALVGRSNTGKSALLNALCGVEPRKGHASVSPRAGHTSAIDFFELREGPLAVNALMTLVDLPGYGPAVGRSLAMRQLWATATQRYVQSREQLASAFVLVDASLGMTPDDSAFLDALDALAPRVQYHVVLTKADLLLPRELAISYELVRRRVCHRAGFAGGDLPITSSRNAAGVRELWERMRLGVVHRVHEMAEAEREELFAGHGGLGAGRGDAEDADEEEEESKTIAQLERMLRKRKIKPPPMPRDLSGEGSSALRTSDDGAKAGGAVALRRKVRRRRRVAADGDAWLRA